MNRIENEKWHKRVPRAGMSSDPPDTTDIQTVNWRRAVLRDTKAMATDERISILTLRGYDALALKVMSSLKSRLRIPKIWAS